MSDDDPTPDEIQRVRRWECRQNGHSWSFVNAFGHEFPLALICDHCGVRLDFQSKPTSPGPDQDGDPSPTIERTIGRRYRVTFEAELLRVEQASGNRGVARLVLRAGRGMCDSVWLVREPGFGAVTSVQPLDPDSDAEQEQT